MFDHEIEVKHRREPKTITMSQQPSESSIYITGTSVDLTTCWKEVLSRMPTDLYTALKAALGEVEASART